MKDEKIAELVEGAKTDQQLLYDLIEMFQPLINSYCNKLFFLERDDAKQELYLAIVESVKSIPHCETNGQCIAYITNAVRFKYCFLCKKNIAKEKILDSYAEIEEKIYIENFKSVEIQYDINRVISQLPEKQKRILQYVLEGYSDTQIAEIMGMSRQYINRIRKQIKLKECEGNV